MVEHKQSVICVGEIMLELSGVKADGSARFGFGGDTGNTAIYLSRLFGQDADVGYLTRLGQGPFADDLAKALRDEGVALSPVAQEEPGTPGLYAISTDEQGERSFTYWRKEAAARRILTGEPAATETTHLNGFDVLYVSGITLAILSDEGREKLFELVKLFKSEGREVMFDVNHRAHLWQSHAPHVDVADVMKNMIALSSVVKIGQDEAELLFGTDDALQTVDQLKPLGDAALVITDGPERIVAFENGTLSQISFEPVDDVVDSTAAGDSFSAGFLHAHMCGKTIVDCVNAGQQLAARVILYPGATIPLADMPN